MGQQSTTLTADDEYHPSLDIMQVLSIFSKLVRVLSLPQCSAFTSWSPQIMKNGGFGDLVLFRGYSEHRNI